MKHIRRASILVGLLLVVGAMSATPASAGVSFDFFYSNLSRDGHWLISASYGRVWQPAVYDPGWNPYYDGHWVYSDVGWTWVSDYAWGSIPYHYGTWVLEPGFGWVWVPGYVWAPSWVVFSTGPDYIGWAPVSPRFAIGVSFGSVYCPPNQFVFVSSRDFLAPHVRRYAVPVSRNNTLVARTRIVNDIRIENQVVINRGPAVRDVERWSGKKVAVRSLENVPRVAAGERFSRAELRVDRDRVGRGVRAAEPRSISRALQDRARGGERIEAPSRGRGAARATSRATQGRSTSGALSNRPRGAERVDAPTARGRGAATATPRATERKQGSKRSSEAKAGSKERDRGNGRSKGNNGQGKANGQAKANGHARGRR